MPPNCDEKDEAIRQGHTEDTYRQLLEIHFKAYASFNADTSRVARFTGELVI